MKYYDERKNDEYVDEFYVPKKDNFKVKNNQKKTIDYKKIFNKKNFIILLLVTIILIVGIVFFMWLKKDDSNKNLRNIIIKDNEYYPEFSSDIYDYYLLTTDEELNINCKISKDVDVTGCNEKINISNYSNYIHEIIIEENNIKKIYKIYIKVKENDNEKNIAIESIDGVNNEWSNQNQTISINAISDNKIVNYSIDNGLNWQESSSFTIENNNNLKVIVADEYGNQSAIRQTSISNIDKTPPIGIIIKEKSNKDEIVLKVISKDEESGIDSYSWNGETYTKAKTLTIKEKGTYYVLVKDKAGNISEKISIDIKESDFNNNTQYSATFYLNGSTSISNNFLICTPNNGKCSITLPTIDREGATIIGWSEEKNSQTANYKPGEKIELSKNIVLHAITKREVKASFNKNGAEAISSNQEKCTLYNDDKYCYVTAPNIIYSNGKIIGWNTMDDADTVLESPKSLIKLYNDENYYALIYKELVVNFNKNGADEVSSTKEICRLKKGSKSCNIITPTIIRDNSDILGWSINKDATSADILDDTELEITKNTTYYAITKKNITITFDSNGSDASTNNVLNCSIYNANDNCQITTPKIYRSGATVVGWSEEKNSKDSEISENKTINVKDNKTYYAITYKRITATFEPNGADSVSESQKSCVYYNAENGCTITTSDITRDSWNILGWNTNKNATKASVKENTEISIKNNTIYYAITYKKVTATFYKNNADSLGNCTTKTSTGCTETCNIYNLNTSCEVNIPYIYSKGNEVQFFSTSSDSSTTVGYSPAKKLNLLDDVKLNAIVDNRYRKYTYSIIKTKNYGYTAFETESGCPSSVYNNYYAFTNRLYQKAPYIFAAAKVTFTSNDTFQETWGNYAGMTYGIAIGYRNVDIKCPTTYSEYYLQTIVHELAHSWDSYYRAKKGYSLSETSDFKNLYNKYSNSSKKPLRTYAYTNLAEFVADAYAWYYFLYIDSSYQPTVIRNNEYYPNDLKLVVEKYINIAKKGYV